MDAPVAPSPASPGVPAPGDVIAGKYVVERLLGVGGMGAVVAARHMTLGQQVAIKVLLRDAAKLPDATARFLREAQAVLRIKSEHVARVLDVGTLESGGPYMIMELLSGEDFAVLLETQGPMPTHEAVECILQACEALAEAHSLGIVHRDLKPSNLFMARRADGTPLVKVLDFGIAKALDPAGPAQKALTATGSVMGSPQYMSPEQIRDSKKVDARADVWALGVILHELLTGHAPFDGESAAAICAAIAADPPRKLRDALPNAPAELEEVLLGCLEKNVAHRVPDVGVLARALEPFAPAHAKVSVERVVRIAERRGEGGTSSPKRAPSAGAFAETIPSQPGGASTPRAPAEAASSPQRSASPRTPEESHAGEGRSARDGSVTRSAWSGSSPGMPRRVRVAALGVVLAIGCGGGALWALRSPDLPVHDAMQPATASPVPASPAPPAEPTHPEAAATATSAAVEVTPATATPEATTAARTASANLPPPASTRPPPHVPSIPAKAALAATTAHAAPPPAPPPGAEKEKGGPIRDPLGDRK